jgi:alpha-N-acetylglucosaminidase
VKELSEKMLGLISDLDELLATRKEFLLGIWLADARKFGGTQEERDRCERGARELLTNWTDRDNTLADYANRQWAGLVGTFYFSRWQTWLAALQSSLAAGAAIDVAAVRTRIADGELFWAKQHDAYPVEARGETLEVSRRLFEKYSADAATPEQPRAPVAGGLIK